MPFSDKPWGQFSESDYETPEKFCASCLIDLNPSGKPKVKALCKLPYKEPSGLINRNAMHNIAARFNQTDAPREEKRAAARKAVRIYREMNEEPPEILRRWAE